jgi:hypothetical protein
MRKKLIFSISILIIGLLVAAYASKPTDKACIIAGVKAVWGDITPDPYKSPSFFEQFMNLNYMDVQVKDRIFFKQIVYSIGKEKRTVGIGAFARVFATVKPVEPKSLRQSSYNRH